MLILRTLLLAITITQAAHCFEIVVDYRFDTQNFFADPARRAALEAAAARFSRVLTSSLLPAEPDTWRIGFDHPGTGNPVQISTATSAGRDPIDPAADVYGFEGLKQDQWLLFAGGRELLSAGQGGTGTGLNYSTTVNDPNGPHHRGVISNTPDKTFQDLPAWGGAITFDVNTDWHFGVEELSSDLQQADFYSIALHEIGHVLGLNAGHWNQWSVHQDGQRYTGEQAVSAYNEDNGTNVTYLSTGNVDSHWLDGQYDSRVFPLGEPAPTGRPADAFQDLLMEPIAHFSPQQRRFELTNVDAAALVDIGWSILEPQFDPLDLNQDQLIDVQDIDLACSQGQDVTAYFPVLGTVTGDVDLNGTVAFPDFLRLAANFNAVGTYSQGDLNCDGFVRFPDFLLLAAHFGDTAAAAQAQHVPEGLPTLATLVALPLWGHCSRRRRRRGRPLLA